MGRNFIERNMRCQLWPILIVNFYQKNPLNLWHHSRVCIMKIKNSVNLKFEWVFESDCISNRLLIRRTLKKFKNQKWVQIASNETAVNFPGIFYRP